MKKIPTLATLLIGITVALSGCSLSAKGTPNRSATAPAPAINVLTLKPTGTPTNSEKQAVFERVWNLFEQHYPSFQFKDVNWSAEKSLFEPQAISAPSWEQFFRVLTEMILTLHDYHSFFIPSPFPTIYEPALLTTYVGNQLVVVAAPDSKIIKPGMVVLGLNGVSINNFMDGIGVKRSLMPDFFRPVGWEIKDVFLERTNKQERITVYNPQDGGILSDTLPVYSNPQRVWKPFGEQHPLVLQNFSNRSSVSTWSLGQGILYIDIPSMSKDLQQILQDDMSKIAKAKGLIIDLRNNGGGTSAPGSWFAQHFYTAPTAALDSRFSGTGVWTPETLQPLLPHISVPTAVLINGGDASSTEMFIAQLQVAPNVATFGSRTMGADGNPRIYPVMAGVQVKISSWQQRIVKTGLPIEQFGIAPMYEVHESYEHLLKELSLSYENKPSSQYDDTLEHAVNWLKSRIQQLK